MLLLNLMIPTGCESSDPQNLDTGQSTGTQFDDYVTEEDNNNEDIEENPDTENEEPSEPESTDEATVEEIEEEQEEREQGPLAIIGIYFDQYSTEHSITQTRWLINVEGPEEYLYVISQYSNSEGYIIAFNQTSDPNEHGFWSRFDYQTSPDILQVCHTTYSAETEEDAFNTPAGALDGDCPGYLYSLDAL